MERNDFSNFGRGSLKEHVCEIILRLVKEEVPLKGFSIFGYSGHFIQRSGKNLAILVKRSPKEHLYKIILKSGHSLRRRCNL